MQNNIDEMIYSISSDTIVGRRYNPLLGIIITAIGAAMFFVNSFIEPFASNLEMHQWMMMGAICVLVVGATMVAYWLFGDSTHPYYKPSSEKMQRTELSFDKVDLNRIVALVEAGDFKALESIPRSNSSSVLVIIYATDSDSVAVAQVQEYIPHEYHPVTDILIFKQGEFKSSQLMK